MDQVGSQSSQTAPYSQACTVKFPLTWLPPFGSSPTLLALCASSSEQHGGGRLPHFAASLARRRKGTPRLAHTLTERLRGTAKRSATSKIFQILSEIVSINLSGQGLLPPDL